MLSFFKKVREFPTQWWLLFFFIAINCFLLPDFVITKSDEFGYLQSVILTIQQGRVITSDFLAPFNCALSILSGCVYILTNNFYLATSGVLFVFSLFNFFLLKRIVEPHVSEEKFASWLSFSICISPLLVYRSAEYSGVLISLTLFYLALLCHRNQRWFWFYIVVFVSYSNRQSALYLLFLPGIHFLQDWTSNRRINYKLIVFTILFGLAMLWLGKTLNPTYAQVKVTDRVFEEFNLVRSVNSFLGVFSIVFFLIEVGLLITTRKFPKLSWIGVGFTLVFLTSVVLRSNEPLLQIDILTISLFTDMLPSTFQLMVLLLMVFGLLFFDYSKILKHYVAFGLVGAYTLLLSIRGVLWDYYLLEPMLCVILLLGVPHIEKMLKLKLFRCIYIGGCLLHIVLLRSLIDISEIKLLAQEELFRNRKTDTHNFTNPTFGYCGWKSFSCFVEQTKSAPFTRLSAFLAPNNGKYTTKIGEAGPESVLTGQHSICYIPVKYWVRDNSPGTPEMISSDCYPIYPLTIEEWKMFIQTRPLSLPVLANK